jgi:hypothetical protein
MEGSGKRWTVGVELEIELLRYPGIDEAGDGELYPTARIGLAIRRKF